jgi:cathepsin F
MWFLAGHTLVSLSEQQLVDCDKTDHGCGGGWMHQAFEYIISCGGQESEADYPYKGYDESCKFDPSKEVAKISNWARVGTDEENDILPTLYEKGPLSLALNAEMLMSYHGGIINPAAGQCNPKALDHGVLYVGYGSENGTPFWIIKNSWGSGWGEQGYFRIVRDKDACGIATNVVYAIV